MAASVVVGKAGRMTLSIVLASGPLGPWSREAWTMKGKADLGMGGYVPSGCENGADHSQERWEQQPESVQSTCSGCAGGPVWLVDGKTALSLE